MRLLNRFKIIIQQLQTMKFTKSNPFITHQSLYHSLLLRKSDRHKQFCSEDSVSNCMGKGHDQHGDEPEPEEPKRPNYILENRRNIRKFFSDRFPHDSLKIGERQIEFSPSEMFSMRKFQCERQQATKIKFNKSIDVGNLVEVAHSEKKIHHCFKLTPTGKERGNREIGRSRVVVKKYCSVDNYRMHTENSMMKYTQTLKNKVYNSVFGKGFKNGQKERRNKYCSEELEVKKVHERARKRTMEKEKKELDDIIVKLQDFYSKINFNGFQLLLKNRSRREEEEEGLILNPEMESKEKLEQIQKQILQFVRRSSDEYRNRNTEIVPIKKIEDIEKLDNIYYKKMVNHKKNRLWVRCQLLNHVNLKGWGGDDGLDEKVKVKEISDGERECGGEDILVEDKEEDERRKGVMASLVSGDKNWGNAEVVVFYEEKYSKFGQYIIRNMHTAMRYNIKIQNIYNAIFKSRKSFELQGSYVLFKLITHNNVDMFRNFITKNREYAHQIDHQCRSCLIYAVMNNCKAIVQLLVRVGVNVDFRDRNGVTALIHAIINNNYQIIELLLRYGASPWSDFNCSLPHLLEGCNQRIKLVIKNARKLHIGQRLKNQIKKKVQFWNLYKNQIQGDKDVKFL